MHQAGGSPQISQPELGRALFGNCREYRQIPGPWSARPRPQELRHPNLITLLPTLSLIFFLMNSVHLPSLHFGCTFPFSGSYGCYTHPPWFLIQYNMTSGWRHSYPVYSNTGSHFELLKYPRQ